MVVLGAAEPFLHQVERDAGGDGGHAEAVPQSFGRGLRPIEPSGLHNCVHDFSYCVPAFSAISIKLDRVTKFISQTGIALPKMKLSRSTIGPIVIGIGAANSGHDETKVWNSPFSPQGSTTGGNAAKRS